MWPAFNATLNALSAALLTAGFISIRGRNRRRHRALMIAAFSVSIVFLFSYLAYHARVGNVRFQGQGWIRPVYFSVLISHTLLAAAVPILAAMALARALRSRFDLHRRIARWALPIWLYVSITGVVVYFMLYHMSV
jgi:uncharacterized membrane protein YozB (DUF420 family)